MKKYANTLITSENGKWVSAVDCHLCKKQIPTKESYISSAKGVFFGVEGYTNVRICKECNREKQLSKLI